MGSNVSQREKENLEAKIKMIEEHNSTLKKEISKLRQNISNLEIKQKEQHKKLKRYKHREQELQSNIAKIQKWNERMDENSLQYLGRKYPDSSNKKLFEDCQKGCICLLEESYQVFANHQEKSKCVTKDMMLCYVELFRKYIKTTINYASLQQAHNGVVNDLNSLKKDVKEYQDGDGNSLNDDALIMASMTASFF